MVACSCFGRSEASEPFLSALSSLVRVRGRVRVRVRVRVGVRVRLLSALSALVPLSPRFEILSRAKRRTTRAISPTARGMAASSTCSSTSDERAKSNDADAKGSRPAWLG